MTERTLRNLLLEYVDLHQLLGGKKRSIYHVHTQGVSG